MESVDLITEFAVFQNIQGSHGQTLGSLQADFIGLR